MIIVVGSNVRNAGKTSLICAILRGFPEFAWRVLKVTPHDHRRESGHTGSGDTERFRRAGAGQAYLRSLAQLPDLSEGHWLIESNRILNVLEPDAYIFLEASSPVNEKPRDRWHLERARLHLVGWTPSETHLPPEVAQLIASLSK